MTPPDEPGASEADDRRQELYDAYLDAVLCGKIESPEDYCRRHEVEDAELLGWLQRLEELGGVPAAPATSPGEPEALGGYEILRRLGRGGSADVYLARQPSLDRRVALKVLRAEHASSPVALERFRREAIGVARLEHPAIVRVHEVAEQEGRHFLVMEWVPGRGLDEVYAASEPLPAPRLLRWAIAIGEALAAAHAAGIVHRDVKPSNIRVTPDDRALLIDFGIARLPASHGPTITGQFAGSPAYSSPEQVRGDRELDGRSDVYSLGATLYEGLAGGVPFEGDDVQQVFRRILAEPAPRLRQRRPDVDPDLAVVVERALEKDPADRYADMPAFVEDLRRVLELRPILARSPGRAARLRKWARRNRSTATLATIAALAILALIGQLAVVSWRDAEREREQRRRAAAQQREDRDRARGLVAVARDRLVGHSADATQARRSASAGRGFERVLRWAPLDEEAVARRHRMTQVRDRFPIEQERVSAEIVSLLSRARQLDPDVEGAGAVMEELYDLRLEDAVHQGNWELARLYSELRAELRGHPGPDVQARLDVHCEPAAPLYLFRYELLADLVEEGPFRIVPVPIGGWPEEVEAGALALRVVHGDGTWREGDCIYRVDGRAVDATDDLDALLRGAREAWGLRGEEWGQAPIGGPLTVRRSAAPPLCTPAARIDEASLVLEELGRYLLLARSDRHELQRASFQITRSSRIEARLRMHERHPSRADCVYVSCDALYDHPGFWARDHEVGAGEYLEFLNHPWTRRWREKEGDTALVPRRTPTDAEGLWPRSERGFALPAGLDPRHPVHSISWHDAQVYVRWLNETAPPTPSSHVWSLPTHHEWIQLASGGGEMTYVHGDVFWPSWIQSRFSCGDPVLEPAFSYPLDESPFGAFDLMGSVAEWGESPGYRAQDPHRSIAGGSWLDADPEHFRVDLHRGARPEEVSPSVGFRVFLRPRDGRR